MDDGSSRSTQSGGPTSTMSGMACNICLRRTPNNSVVTICGHLFCWSCLYRSWPQQQQGPAAETSRAITKPCPVCGTGIGEGFNIIPIYGPDTAASPRPGAERPTPTGPTTAAAAAAPDTATSPSTPAAAAANNPIPPRPTTASFFTAARRRPYSDPTAVATLAALSSIRRFRQAAAAAAAAAAISSDTGSAPRPNPPARSAQTTDAARSQSTQTQTDAVRTRSAETESGAARTRFRLGSLLHQVSTAPRHPGLVGEVSSDSGSGGRLRPSSSSSSAAARHVGLGVAFRSLRRRSSVRWSLLGLDDGDGGSRWESEHERMGRELTALNRILARLTRRLALLEAVAAVEVEISNWNRQIQ